MSTLTPPRRVAVVGSGVAGLTAAYVASRTAEVTLFEADDRLGGHADTHDVTEADGRHLAIDTGFIVHNERTYPVLLRMFAELGVATQPSEMSMSIRDDETGLEWAGALGRKGVFPSARHLANPLYLRMLSEIPRFHRAARALLATQGSDVTLRDFLAAGGFTPYFLRHFMEPLVAAVWSCDPEVSLDYPARYLFTFLQHHGMLSVFGSPEWRTVTGGSREYVARVAATLADRGTEIRTGTKVTSILETDAGVELTDGNGAVSTYDAVVVATHPGQALAMLAEPTTAQREVLSAMPYSPNVAVLHTDTSVLPQNRNTWASWNFRRAGEPASRRRAERSRRRGADSSLREAAPDVSRPADAAALASQGVLVTYDLTRLQRLDTDVHYLVTLGGEHLVDPATVIERMEYEHPLYNPASVAAQQRLAEIDSGRVAFAGAYHGWGFHEDGARSGLRAAEHLGLEWPTTPRPAQLGPVEPRVYATTIRHVRRTPFKRSFEHRSHTWLVDLDHLPDHGVIGRFEARDHLGDPGLTIRANLEAFLAAREVDLGGGQVLMAANARAFGHCFNPISVFWCWDRAGDLAATVVEVHNTYGDRHAYLVHPDANGRASTPKAMYVSPFHGTDGTYELAVPVPGRSLQIAVTLHSDDGTGDDGPNDERAVFSAALTGRRTDHGAWRAAPAALRGSALIRAHGIWLWLRRLPIRPRPHHNQEGVSR